MVAVTPNGAATAESSKQASERERGESLGFDALARELGAMAVDLRALTAIELGKARIRARRALLKIMGAALGAILLTFVSLLLTHEVIGATAEGLRSLLGMPSWLGRLLGTFLTFIAIVAFVRNRLAAAEQRVLRAVAEHLPDPKATPSA